MIGKEMKFHNVFSLLAVALFSGCATEMNTVERVVGVSAPVNYKTGFAHGCDSGKAAINFGFSVHTKDFNLARSDRDYALGWNEGYVYCRDKYIKWKY
jgi:hypothetical protein